MNPYKIWQEKFKESKATKHSESLSGIEIAPVFSSQGPVSCDQDLASFNEELPGVYPFTRGPYASMYRSKLWTMRMFAGFGTPKDTNLRFKEILSAGGTGLSVAFDLPTLMGRDSDDPRSLGEVGKCGVAVDTLKDMQDLFEGINLSAITTSMTINSPAAILLAMYVAVGDLTKVKRSELGGTLQNDILKEYQAQKEYIFPPRPSLRLVNDVMRFTFNEMPKYHPISVSGYHIREAGSSAVQELAFTLANGFAYLEYAKRSGLDISKLAEKFSFFFNAHIDFFEEIAKLRAARRIWAKWLKNVFGINEEKALAMRFHVQTAGCSLTAFQPEVNIVRTAIEALAGVLGGAQSLHTNSLDEALALPSQKAVRIALRTQQVIAYETNVANVADPLGGSYYLEWLTDELEKRANEIFDKLIEFGHGSILEGVISAIEAGWFQSEILEEAYRQEKNIADRKRIIVSVNDFFEGNEEKLQDILYIDKQVEEKQIKSLKEVKSQRSFTEVTESLNQLKEAAKDPTSDLMTPIIRAVKTYATVGEIINVLAEVFGRWEEPGNF
jgi:methylmalonyl-CoA mutase N-terminal domain/subunit